ncbi:MAG: hypothetical protein GY726_06550 [Proteobacteria bacterium]|nr:hypothetical protein [Pseudomonadota bacterium]
MSRIVVIYETPNMTAEQYDRIDSELRSIGMTKPDGRLYHVSASTENGWYVTDVWQSIEQLDQFSKTLIPILEKNGIQSTPPRIMQIHNLITDG